MSQCDTPRSARVTARPERPDLRRLKQLAINESGFVFDPITGLTFNVNITGLAIVRALKDGVAVKDLTKTLAETFERDVGDDLTSDIEDFLTQLSVHGLLPSSPAA